MHAFHYRNGRLHCEDVDLERVASAHGTPLYIYSAGTILGHYRRLHAALAGLDHLICYAVKANSNRAVLQLLNREGAGFDIVSGGELYRVISAGGDPRLCTFAGVGKLPGEIEYALEQQVFSFNVESEAELDCIQQIAARKHLHAPIALRVNPDVEAGSHKYISTGRKADKFGIALERAAAVYEAAAGMSHIRIRGVQMHIGSQITEAEPFAAAIEKVAPLVRELKQRYDIEFLSIGGGMGIAYESSFASGSGEWWDEHARSSHHKPLTITDYAEAIVPPLRDLGVRVLLEPGRLLVGNAGVLLTRVLYRKESGGKKFVVIDAGMNDLIRPALYQSYHEIVPVREPSAKNVERVDVVGPVCESGDFFAQDREMQQLQDGELAAVMSAGAYGFVMASNYNSRPLPAEVLVRGDDCLLVRQRQTYADIVRGEQDLD